MQRASKWLPVEPAAPSACWVGGWPQGAGATRAYLAAQRLHACAEADHEAVARDVVQRAAQHHAGQDDGVVQVAHKRRSDDGQHVAKHVLQHQRPGQREQPGRQAKAGRPKHGGQRANEGKGRGRKERPAASGCMHVTHHVCSACGGTGRRMRLRPPAWPPWGGFGAWAAGGGWRLPAATSSVLNGARCRSACPSRIAPPMQDKTYARFKLGCRPLQKCMQHMAHVRMQTLLRMKCRDCHEARCSVALLLRDEHFWAVQLSPSPGAKPLTF